MRPTRPPFITTLIASFAAVPVAFAYDDQADPGDGAAIVEHIFAVSDLDADGALSSEEYETAGLAEFGLSFEACDRDANGELTSQEFLDVYRQHHPSEPGLDV